MNLPLTPLVSEGLLFLNYRYLSNKRRSSPLQGPTCPQLFLSFEPHFLALRMAGGVAGGAKFFHDDIFFKFPVDVNNLYGGEEGLMKACGHELKGLMSYIDCRIRGLCFPLMVIVDFRGWRLIAESVLPLGSLKGPEVLFWLFLLNLCCRQGYYCIWNV